jgi:hypothetical protein
VRIPNIYGAVIAFGFILMMVYFFFSGLISYIALARVKMVADFPPIVGPRIIIP